MSEEGLVEDISLVLERATLHSDILFQNSCMCRYLAVETWAETEVTNRSETNQITIQ